MSKPSTASTGNHPSNHHHETQVTIVTTQKRTHSPLSQDQSQSDNVPKSQRQPHFSNGSQQSQMLLANQLKRMEKPMDHTNRPLSPMSQSSQTGALRQVSCQGVVDVKVHSHQSALAANLPQSDSAQMMSVARNLTKSQSSLSSKPYEWQRLSGRCPLCPQIVLAQTGSQNHPPQRKPQKEAKPSYAIEVSPCTHPYWLAITVF